MTNKLIDSDEISAFLDEPDEPGKQSRVYVRFIPDQYIKTVIEAMSFVYHFKTIPTSIYELGNVTTVKEKVEVQSLCLGELIFGCSPASGNADDDLAAILDWFRKSDVVVELMPRRVKQWYPQQLSGAPHLSHINLDSWVPIVNDVCRQIQAILTADELPEFHWLQISQNDGGLIMFWAPMYRAVLDPAGPYCCMDFESRQDISWRFDVCETDFAPATTRRVQEIIAEAQVRAAKTCEDCGAAGTLRQESRESVLCDECSEAWEQTLAENLAANEIWQRERSTSDCEIGPIA